MTGVATLPITTIGATEFAALTWGAIALVLVAFGYLVWTLLGDRAAA